MENSTKTLLISFLIPMRNEARFIEKCIRSLLVQDYSEIEIWVLDGNSDDASKAIVYRMFQGRENCHLLDNPNRTQAAAWNESIKRAHGEILAIVSAHAELAPDYATQLVATLMRTKADMVGGPTFSTSQGYVAEAIALAMNSPFGVGGAAFHYTNREIEVDTVFMGACWRSVYEKIGGFDEEMVRNQDDELSYRLRENGGRIVCNPAIKSHYYNRVTLIGLWQQYFDYGYWKVRVLQKHPLQMRPRQFAPPAFVFSLLLSLLLVLFPTARFLSPVIPLLYLFANLAASLWVASQHGRKYLPLLPIIYATLHLSYGLGFLVGLVKFANRWADRQGKVPNF